VNSTTPGGQWKEFPYVKKELGFYVQLAARHGLKANVIGQLGDFGYTNKVPGFFHHMISLTHAS
jgi:hypothetical protein